MELKYRHSEESIALIGCFNRTFMELKSENIYAALGIKYVLIVPLWNWNFCIFMSKENKDSFNRTFMELKLTKSYDCLTLSAVLIVPLWNWNNISPDSQSRVSCFNRTFMELKLSDRLVTEETEGLF